MPSEASSSNPLDQLVELFVYAPVGLLYEYPEVIPKLVKRGRSQVQLARLLAQMAANQARAGSANSSSGRPGGLPALDTLAAVLAPGLGEAAGAACNLLARLATDLGATVGLAPQAPPAGNPPRAAEPAGRPAPAAESAAPHPPAPTADAPAEGGPLPIAGYDSLTAREVIGLLDDLSPRQRQQVRAHEAANRGRKTILAKLDQLDLPG